MCSIETKIKLFFKIYINTRCDMQTFYFQKYFMSYVHFSLSRLYLKVFQLVCVLFFN